MDKVKKLLSDYGLTPADYVISLQGPTIIPTTTGEKELHENFCLKADLKELGFNII